MKFFEVFFIIYGCIHLAIILIYCVFLIIKRYKKKRRFNDVVLSRLSDIEERLFEIEFQPSKQNNDEKIPS